MTNFPLRFAGCCFSRRLLGYGLAFFVCMVVSWQARGQPLQAKLPSSILPADVNRGVQEKVFVQTDRSFYLTGETLWLQAYVLNAATTEPSRLSRVVYVEVLDDRWQPALQAMLPLENGMGEGSFVLPTSLPSGMYLLRAYTAWMKNFTPAAFFQTPLQVVNTTRRPDWARLEKKQPGAVHVYPEGGPVVEGLSSKIGFRLTDSVGRGTGGVGYLIQNGADTIARFQPLRFGIGSFVWTPQKGAVYRAVVQLAGGDTLSVPLPPVQASGRVMQVSEKNGALQVTVVSQGVNETQPLSLVAESGGVQKLSLSKMPVAGRTEWTVDKTTLGEGMTRLTVFDAARQVVASRLFFQQPGRQLRVAVAPDSSSYHKRSKAALVLQTKNEKGEGVPATLSVSVFLLDSLQGMDLPSMEASVWLLPELRPGVENPDYYLSGESETVKAALDNLLLVYGSPPATGARPFPAPLPYLPEYEGPVIRGRVVRKATGAPVAGVLCYLSAPGERFYVGNAVSDSAGELRFAASRLYGSLELVAQTAGADSSLRVELLNPYAEVPPAYALPPFTLPEKWKESLNHRHLNVQLASRFAPPGAGRFQPPVFGDSLLFYGQPDRQYWLDEYTRFPTMEEVMREVTAEVRVQKEGDSFHYRVVNLPYKQMFTGDPLVLLDGVPVFQTNRVVSFDPLRVKRVDVLARTFFWGNTVNQGIVSYATYEGNLAGFDLGPGAELLGYTGLQLRRVFSAPAYGAGTATDSREPDRRTVLLWQGSVRTATDGKAALPFFVSDVPGRYAVRVTGLGTTGRVGSGWAVLVVK